MGTHHLSSYPSEVAPSEVSHKHPITTRLKLFHSRNYKKLLDGYMQDRAIARSNIGLPSRDRRPASAADAAVVKVSKGQISRARACIESVGLADISNPSVMSDLISRFPKLGANLLPLASEFGEHCPFVADLGPHFRSLKDGRGASFIASTAITYASRLCSLLLSGSLPKWYHMVIAAVVVVPMGKPGASDECRPISVGDAFRCACWSYATKLASQPSF